MAAEVPPGFTNLGSVVDKKFTDLDLMGVVVDFLPAKQSRRTDWMCTFNIVDVSSNESGLRVKYFAPESRIPKIQGTGDVVILRRIQLKNWQGADILLSNFNTTWTVFHSASIPQKRPIDEPRLEYTSMIGGTLESKIPTAQEMLYAIDLCNTRDRSSFYSPPSTVSMSTLGPREKFSLIKDIGEETYYDLVGQVVKMWSGGDRMDLHITDYTSNNLLFDYDDVADDQELHSREGDEYGYTSNTVSRNRKWTGPSGQLTLAVTLFSPHSDWARRKLKEGEYVLLTNVHVKNGKNDLARLEGIIHEDRKFPDRVCVSVVTAQSDERVKEVLKRKRDHQRHYDQEHRDGKVGGLKRKSDGSGDGKPAKKSKGQQRKERARESKKASNPQSSGDVVQPTDCDLKVETRAAIRAAYREPNKNIACMNLKIPIRTVSSILSTSYTHAYTTPSGTPCTLPFQNVHSRATVRVVDFKPNRLEDFAVKCRLSEFDNLSDYGDGLDNSSHSSSDDDDDDDVSLASTSPILTSSQEEPLSPDEDSTSRSHKWTWRFALLLEDASNASLKTPSDRLIAHVTEEDAEYLLNMTATNLHRSPRALAALREKLFLLWGELEERKARALSVPGAADDDAPAVSMDVAPARVPLGQRDPNAGNEARGQGGGPGVEGKELGSEAPKLTKAFSCCLKEYGVKVRGEWQRRWRLFGTNIMA